MRALIIYSDKGGVGAIARGVEEGFVSRGWKVDLLKSDLGSSPPISCAGYDIICVGSPVEGGLFGGKLPQDIVETVKRCTRLEGKRALAFVTPKAFGTGKAMRALMSLLEGQGALVNDFSVIGSAQEAKGFARSFRI